VAKNYKKRPVTGKHLEKIFVMGIAIKLQEMLGNTPGS
jgi:hypothetical protein